MVQSFVQKNLIFFFPLILESDWRVLVSLIGGLSNQIRHDSTLMDQRTPAFQNITQHIHHSWETTNWFTAAPLSVNDPHCGAETDSVSILKRANPPRAVTRSCYSCDLGLSELFGHSYSGCEDHSRREEKIKGGRDRKKIRAATLIFDVIKRHSPQPVDDITDTIGTISGLFWAETASEIQI